MPAKPAFTKSQYEVLRVSARKAQKRFKNQEEFALALSITQPSVSALLAGKWKPGVSTAKAIAHALGTTLNDLIGDYDEPRISDAPPPLPNLDVCIQFHTGTRAWSAWTVAAARAGVFGEADMPAPDWASKLDALESELKRLRSR